MCGEQSRKALLKRKTEKLSARVVQKTGKFKSKKDRRQLRAEAESEMQLVLSCIVG